MSALERAILLLVLAVLAIDVALIATADPVDDGSRNGGAAPATVEPATLEDESPGATDPAAAAERPGTTDPSADRSLPSCRAIPIPASPPEPVRCRSASAQLTIVATPDPLVLGDTQVRVLDAQLAGSALRVRLRVRNESDAEQGLQAGGQELYLNVAGIRVDPQPVGDVRIPPMTGVTAALRFVLTPARRRIVRERGGNVELGVRPWTTGAPGVVGVIRFQADTAGG